MGTRAKGSKGSSIDLRRFLESRLERGSRRVRGADMATGVALILVVWLSYLLVGVVIDQTFVLPAVVRLALLCTCLLATLAIAGWWIVRPMIYSVNVLYTAKSLESAKPGMKNSFVNWTELSKRSEEIPDVIMKTIENKAAQDLARVKVEDAIQPRYVLPSLYTMAGIVIAFCLYTQMTSKDLLASFQRVLLPMFDVLPPTATELRISFDPGENVGSEPTPLPMGASLTVKSNVVRGKPSSMVAYVRAEGSDYEEPHNFEPTSVRNEFVLTLPQRQKTFDLVVVADDFRSRSYRVPVTAAPMIAEWHLTYTPPAYTGDAPFETTNPDIDGLEGTTVRVEATANLPVRPTGAAIELDDRLLDMKPVENAETKLAGEILLTKDGTYRVKFQDAQGRSPDFRPNHTIRVRKDLPPTVEFVSPTDVETECPVDRPFPVEAKVQDDFGIRHSRLVFQKKGAKEPIVDVEKGGPGEMLGRSFVWRERLIAADHQLAAGDIVEYWIESRDSRLPVSGEVSTVGERRHVRLTPPSEKSPEDRSTEPPGEESPPGEQVARNDQEKGKGDEGSKDASKNSAEQGADSGEESGSGKEGDAPAGEDATGSADSKAGKTKSTDARSGQKEGEPGGENASDEMTPEDRASMDRLQKYFDKEKRDKASGDSKGQEPVGHSKDDGAEKGPSESAPKQANPTADSSTEQQAKAKPGENGTPGNESKETLPKNQQEPGEQGSAENAPKPSGEQKQQGSEGNPSSQGQGDKQKGEASNSSQGESSSGKSGEPGQPAGSESKEAASSKGDSASEGPRSNPADSPAGEDKGDSPKPDGSEGGEKRRSAKVGNDDASASPEGNSDGSSSGGEGSTQGMSDQGSSSQSDRAKPDTQGQKVGERPAKDGDRPSSESNDGTGKKGSESSRADNPSTGKDKGKASQAEGKERSSNDEQKESASGKKEGAKPADSKEGGASGSESEGNSEGGEESGSSGEGKPTQKPSSGEAKNGSPNGAAQGSEAAEQGAGEKGQPAGKQPAETKEGNSSGGPASEGGRMTGGGEPGQEAGSNPAESPSSNQINDNAGDMPNEEDKQKGSNLVLRKLSDELEKKKVDPELLKEMGWTEEDARRFAERMKQEPTLDPSDPLSAAKRKGFGQGTDLRKSTGRGAGSSADQLQDLFSGRRTPPPPEVRKRYEAYMRSLSTEGSPMPTPASPEK